MKDLDVQTLYLQINSVTDLNLEKEELNVMF